jgi:hypothetical protein
METAAGAQRTAARAGTDVRVSAPPGSANACQELRCQFDAAVAFADYCTFLTAGASSDRASQLVDAAEALLAEAMQALGHSHAVEGRDVDAIEQGAGRSFAV